MLRKLNFNDGLVRAEWQNLYCRNHHLLPYASREYNELFNKYFRYSIKPECFQKLFKELQQEFAGYMLVLNRLAPENAKIKINKTKQSFYAKK